MNCCDILPLYLKPFLISCPQAFQHITGAEVQNGFSLYYKVRQVRVGLWQGSRVTQLRDEISWTLHRTFKSFHFILQCLVESTDLTTGSLIVSFCALSNFSFAICVEIFKASALGWTKLSQNPLGSFWSK